MITLMTGTPGDGKTLYTLVMLKAMAEREQRQVYFSGVRGCNVPCSIPWLEFGKPSLDALKPWNTEADEWYQLPHGSIVLIDEAQRLFRPRGTASAVPKYVAELENHRHSGLDVFLVTQHPMLIDSNVRRLVGRHFHSKRKFGAPASTVHEWSQVKERPDQNRAESVRHEFLFPKSAYAWYKSAEVHTHKLRIPMRVYAMVLIPLLLAACVFGTVKWVKGRTGDEAVKRIAGAGGVVAPAGGVSAPRGRAGQESPAGPGAVAQYLDSYQPRVPGLPHTAARYDEVSRAVSVPFPAACMASGNRCQCYTDQATRLDIPKEICRQIVERGFYVDFAVHRTESVESVARPVVPVESFPAEQTAIKTQAGPRLAVRDTAPEEGTHAVGSEGNTAHYNGPQWVGPFSGSAGK